jgi:hypothetical protein
MLGTSPIPCLLLFAAFIAQAPVYVGVLEPPSDARGTFRIRVAFRFQDGHWGAMPHDAPDLDSLAAISKLYPRSIAWTVAFDGKKAGTLNGLAPANWERYADVGIEELTAGAKPPAVRAGAAAFATWMGVPAFRPLVTISQPSYGDPDRWKPFRPAAELGRAIALNPRYKNLPAQSIWLLPKGYRSSRGDVLLAVRADEKNERDGGYRESDWFLLRNGAFHFVGNELTLLDAGDYDGDGTSEVIFQQSGENRDGYVLLHVSDVSTNEFSWSYH